MVVPAVSCHLRPDGGGLDARQQYQGSVANPGSGFQNSGSGTNLDPTLYSKITWFFCPPLWAMLDAR